jgi:hypothetical protein
VIKARKFFGDFHGQALPGAGTLLLAAGFAKFWSLRANGAGLFVQLENPTTARLQYKFGLMIRVWNSGGVNSFVVKDHLANSLVTIAAGEVYEFILSTTSANAWTAPLSSYAWVVRKRLKCT